MNVDLIAADIALLLSNLQFYVAVGTISMAITTAWSVRRQGRLDRIKDIRDRIHSFYYPVMNLFTFPWPDDDRFQAEWNRIRPFVRNASNKTQNALFGKGIYEKMPWLQYVEGDTQSELEYNAWDNFYNKAWEDLRKLDSILMKLQRTKGTETPKEPYPHNFNLEPLPIPKKVKGMEWQKDSKSTDENKDDLTNKR